MARNVTMIPARRRVGNSIQQEEMPKLKVAAYCRVSTDSEEQASSYDVQVEHYTDYIRKNPEWEYAGIYADDGISGTNTKNREEFNRMIADCKMGKIDLIITKSISRFARNTIDCLRYIRDLKDINIPVYFEKENINTMDAKGEVLITIMASLAQQESQSLSQNVKLGYQFRYQKGEITVNHNRFLGYTKDEEGNLIVDEDEAVIIRRIFREYLEGMSLQQIGKGLEKDGILTGAGKKKWRPETLRKMLSNEKYMGDALLQKTYTTDFLNKTRVVNNGIVPQYYVEDSHEAIIPKDIFMNVQEEMARRGNVRVGKKKRVYSSRYALSSMVFCPKCGDIYRRIAWNNRGKHSVVWRCCTRVENGPSACDADTIKEEELQQVVVKAMNRIYSQKELMLQTLESNIQKVLEEECDPTLKIDARLVELQQLIVKKVNEKLNYDDITEEIYRLRDEKQNLQVKQAERSGYIKRLEQLKAYLYKTEAKVTEYDEGLVRTYLEKIVVFEDYYEVTFKSGDKLNIER